MSLKNRPDSPDDAAAAVLLFGVLSLHNTSLTADFYPEDLPADWRLSYYSNEFNLLLFNLADLLAWAPQLEAEAEITVDLLLESLKELGAELDAEFTLLFDISSCDSSMRTALLEWQTQNDVPQALSLLDMTSLCEQQVATDIFGSQCFVLPMPVNGEISLEAGLLCLLNDREKLSALALRELIEGLRKTGKPVMVFFSAEQYALENTRNAIMLESMM